MTNKTAPDPEAEDRFSIVRRRYGHQLNAEELAEVRKGIDGVMEAAKALKAVKLDNGDAPFFTFVPYRKEE